MKQFGLGEVLLEAETLEEQESPVNCFRKLFGKKNHILYDFLMEEIEYDEMRLYVESKGVLHIMKLKSLLIFKFRKTIN